MTNPDPTTRWLSLLGKAELCLRTEEGNETVVLERGKPLAILTYLHCSLPNTFTRDHLCDLLWSNSTPEKARATLRSTLSTLRRQLGVNAFDVAGDVVRLRLTVHSDRGAMLERFEAEDFEGVVASYKGDFHPHFAAPGGASFELWADTERARLRGLFLSAAARVVRDHLANGRAREAIRVAQAVNTIAPTQQSSWRLLLESNIAGGDSLRTAIEVERLERWLFAENLDPEPPTAQLIKAARSSETAAAASENSHDTPDDLHADLVGREVEFSILVDAYDAIRLRSRHVHVTGAAGLGKTRLLEGFADRLRSSRARAVSVRATPTERGLPYAFAANLVSALVQLRAAPLRFHRPRHVRSWPSRRHVRAT